MKTFSPSLQHLFDLGDLSQAGAAVNVMAAADDLPRLAQWAGVQGVNAFRAAVDLRRISTTRFGYAADLEAEIVQNCVVTLEPVVSRIARHIDRELHLVQHAPAEEGELSLAAGDDDVPETITSLDFDLAAPLLEELALAIDPYPRKAGVAFTPPAEAKEPPESPFAVLKSLKEKG